MAVLGGGSTRIETNNKIQLEDGTYNIVIVDEWVYCVTKEPDGTYPDGSPKFRSKYSRTPTDDREIRIAIALEDDKSIILEKRMPAYVSKNAGLAKMIGSLTGLVPGSDEMKAYDTKALVGLKGVADLKFNGNEEKPWTNVKEVRARPKTLARPAVRPAPAFTAEDAAKLGIEAPGDDEFAGLDEPPF